MKIDHNPEYDQGFRDATAQQISELRQDEWQRYRENQYREDRKRVDSTESKCPSNKPHDVVRFERSYYSRLAESPNKVPETNVWENLTALGVVCFMIVLLILSR